MNHIATECDITKAELQRNVYLCTPTQLESCPIHRKVESLRGIIVGTIYETLTCE